MGTSSWLATWLDSEMLERRGVTIPSPIQARTLLSHRSGTEIAAELGGRCLLRYLVSSQIGLFAGGSDKACYTTPTAYSPEEAVRYLVLPRPETPRNHVLLLDPARVPLIMGPMWAAAGRGIQYVLPDGFPPEAIVVPGAVGVQWEVEVS